MTFAPVFLIDTITFAPVGILAMTSSTFDRWFQTITGHASPRPWQDELAADDACRTRLIRIPTGLGKTDGVLAAWSFHRLQKQNKNWPRRLVWCLPMRVLVEQTVEEARKLASRMDESVRPTIHIAMGGEDSSEWFLYPERPAVIIGTQDMLLSRALNRGYASGRARWPMEFGLLNQDALWVMDEVQLMDVGLATSAQIQAFRDDDGGKHLRPCHTWWMSATLQPDWLRSVDTDHHHPAWTKRQCTVPAAVIEAGAPEPPTDADALIPWLRGHGPIEAVWSAGRNGCHHSFRGLEATAPLKRPAPQPLSSQLRAAMLTEAFGSIQSQCRAGCSRTGSPLLRADLTSIGPQNTFFPTTGN